MKKESNSKMFGQVPSGKMVPISTRISQQDAEFLAGLDIQGATTPSEKLRELIAEARRRHESTQDYRSSLAMYQDMLNQVVTRVRELELEFGVHSEMVSRLTEWLPDMLAYMVSMDNSLQQSPDEGQLKRFEDGITDRSFRLIQSILQMGITETCPCYEESVVSKRIGPIVKLINIIQK